MLSRLPLSLRTFEILQRLGIHVKRKHFYSPIPDTAVLKANDRLWEDDLVMPGVDLNVEGQLDLLREVVPNFRDEYDFPVDRTDTPHEYFAKNGGFGFTSAAMLHCMIRHFRPRRVVEVGSGYSTFVSARACLMNQADGCPTKLVSIEPYPNPVLRKGFPGLSELIPRKVEDVSLECFSQLSDGDILFIDSSHVIRIGGDVNFLYLEVLPRLSTGVVVHVHDIFFPRQYPKPLVTQNLMFWTEQYLLQAFLTHNDKFQVLWCGNLLRLKYPEQLKAALPPPEGVASDGIGRSSSFWMRKVGA